MMRLKSFLSVLSLFPLFFPFYPSSCCYLESHLATDPSFPLLTLPLSLLPPSSTYAGQIPPLCHPRDQVAGVLREGRRVCRSHTDAASPGDGPRMLASLLCCHGFSSGDISIGSGWGRTQEMNAGVLGVNERGLTRPHPLLDLPRA